MIRTLLVFPPNFSVDQPYLALPLLVSFLRENGIRAIRQFDANIDSFQYFTRKGYLKGCYTRIRAEHKRIESRVQKGRRFDEEKYLFLCEASVYFPAVIRNIRKSIDYFGALKKSDIEEYNFHKNVIDRAFDAVSAAHYPTEISIRDFAMRFSSQRFSDILKAAKSQENPYIEYFKERVLPRIRKGGFNLIGLSVAASSQIIPSFTLAYLIKKHFPGAKVVFGGQVFNRLEDSVKDLPRFFRYVDFLIVNEGETALLQLIKYLEGKLGIDEIPNLLYRSGAIVKKNQEFKEDMDSLPPPSFDGLSLSKYLAPVPVLSYQPVRGCYWHKCKFCNQFLIYGRTVRCRSLKRIIGDLKYLKSKYKTPYFALINESVAPTVLARIARGLIDANLGIKWYAGARFEDTFDRRTLALLKRSGCEKLYFGLESGSQKVLTEMNKGIDLKAATRILRDCKELDIAIHLFILLGFPTETNKDLEVSKRFIYKNLAHVDKDVLSFYISIYQLKPETPVFDSPHEFNIKSICRKDGYDLEFLYEFERAQSDADIDYVEQRQEIEDGIDRITGTKRYPESIVHFLSYKNLLSGKTSVAFDTALKRDYLRDKRRFQINPELSFGRFKYYESTLTRDNSGYNNLGFYCVYDIGSDNLLEIPDKDLWTRLKEMDGSFTLRGLERLLHDELSTGTNDVDSVRSLVEELIANKIVVALKRR